MPHPHRQVGTSTQLRGTVLQALEGIALGFGNEPFWDSLKGNHRGWFLGVIPFLILCQSHQQVLLSWQSDQAVATLGEPCEESEPSGLVAGVNQKTPQGRCRLADPSIPTLGRTGAYETMVTFYIAKCTRKTPTPPPTPPTQDL